MDLGTVIMIAIAGTGVLLVVYVQIKDYLGKRDARVRWQTDVDSDRSSFNKFMDEIRAEIRKIHERIDAMFRQLPKLLSESSSPLRLTELGKTVSQCLADRNVVATLLPAVRAKIQDMPEEYEIHDACFDYLHSDQFEPSHEINAALRLCAYQHGVKRDGVLEVLAITLRDELLSERASTSPPP